MIYAGFWRRIGAGVIDNVVLHIGCGVILSLFGVSLFNDMDVDISLSMVNKQVLTTTGSVGILASWLYYAFFQSSKYMATPGMMLLGMRLTTYQNTRVSFLRATGRFFASLLSALLFCFGYLMIVFTPRKQALHDYMAKTLVVKE